MQMPLYLALFALISKEISCFSDLYSQMISELVTFRKVSQYQNGSTEKKLMVHSSLEIMCFIMIVG